MLEISEVKITTYPEAITTFASRLSNEEKEFVLNICHKHKHMYLDGYPHGKKTRRKLRKQGGIEYDKWADSPEIDIVYYLSQKDERTEIIAIIGNLTDHAKRYTERELELFLQNWQQSVIEEISALTN